MLLMYGLSEECRRVCVAARSKVKTVFFHLQNDRKVTLNDLHGMITNIDQVEKLCKAVEEEKFAYNMLSAALEQGKQELLFLQKHKHAYQAICDLFHGTSKVKGIIMCVFIANIIISNFIQLLNSRTYIP